MKNALFAVVGLLAGCSNLQELPAHTQKDAQVAADIARENGDMAGAACFSALATRRIIEPVGPLSALAAARAARLGRPMACDSVLLDIQRRAVPLLN